MASETNAQVVRPSRYLSQLQVQWLAAGSRGTEDQERPNGGTRLATPGAAHQAIPGTVVFADVSGFTALSDRLARRGRAGAEELTDLINAVTCRLLAVTRPLGGDLLKYGGDAVLLLFSGNGHQQRAVVSAAAMQTALREFRSFSSESGRISLQMSIGVESGDVNCFLVGIRHRELLVAGPTVSRAVRLQELAGPRQIVVGAQVAAGLPAGWLGQTVAAGARLLKGRPHGLSSPTELAYVPTPRLDDRALTGVPVALRDALGSVDGEHRQVAVGFVQCGGVDDLLRREGPATVAETLHVLADVASSSCAEHGVTFLATDVGVSTAKLVFAAGAPITSPDDEDRLLAVLRAVVDTHSPLPVRAGAHRGRVFAVEVGDDERRVYTVLGDTVNLAARMMAAAPDNGILATSAVLGRLRVPYARQPVDPFRVKGLTEPVNAALVGTVTPVTGGPETGLPDRPMVGRWRELDILRRALAEARSGRRAVVQVVGEPGIGKSRLIAEALSHAGDLPVVSIQARQYAKAEPYGAVRAPLRSLLRRIPSGIEDMADRLAAVVDDLVPDLAPVLPLLGAPFGLRFPETTTTTAMSADDRRDGLRSATTRLLLRLFPDRGVLAIEDPYWLDDGSAQLLTRLVAVLPGWAVFVADRPADRTVGRAIDLSEVEGVVRLTLDPLPVAAMETLAASAGRLTTAEFTSLALRSGGNPLFLQELTAAVAGGASLDELPDTVEAVIAAHLDTLDRRDRDLVRIAAVLGSDFCTDLLLDLAGFSDHEAGRDRLGRLTRILESRNGNTRFSHALVRESAYAGLSFRRRRSLHGKAADLILASTKAPEQEAALLSLHYHAARRYEECWEWSLAAAEQARRDAAPVEAVTLLRRALESARPAGVEPFRVGMVQEQLGDVAELAGLYELATDAYRRARSLRRSDPVVAADLLRKQGDVAERAGSYPAALRLYSRGFRTLGYAAPGPATARSEVELTMAYGSVRLRQGRYVEAIRILEQAVHLAELADDLASLAHAYYLLDWAHTDLGRPDPRYRALALPIYQELGDWRGQGNVLNNLGADAAYEGRWADAVEFYRRSRAAFARVGAAVFGAAATHNIGEILCDQGYFDEARTELSTALEIWESTAYPGAGLAKANLGRLAARTGDFEEAEGLLADGRQSLRRIGAHSVVVDVQLRELERLVLMGHPDAALDLAESVRSRAGQPVQMVILDRMTGWARAQRGEFDAARAALYAGLRTAQRISARYEEARTRAALARIATLCSGQVAIDAWADAVLHRLGVIWSPAPPLAVRR